MIEELVRIVDGLKPEIVSFTEELIKVRTENPPGNNYKECANLIVSRFRDFNIESEIIEIEGKDPDHTGYAIIAEYGEGDSCLYYHCHYDVVPAQNDNQFEPYIKDGDLFGRGSADMKGGIALIIYSVRALQLLGSKINGKIIMVFVPDEETGGEFGTEYLFRNGYLKNKGCMIMPEPTDGNIWNACRGALTIFITLKGKSVHSALGYKGSNAFEDLIRTADKFIELKEKISKRETDYTIFPDEAKKSILMLGGYLKGGNNFNLVPDECTFSIDRRFNPEEEIAEVKNEIDSILRDLKQEGLRLSVEIIQEGDSAGINKNHPIIKLIERTAVEITGSKPEVYLCPGLLETRFFIKNGIPAVCFGPGSLRKAHGREESVNIKSVMAFTVIYALIAHRLLNQYIKK